MLDSNSIIVNDDLIFSIYNDIISENKVHELDKTTNDICIKMLDYLMF